MGGRRRAPAGCTVYLETYGCQMNQADSEVVAGILAAAGYQLTREVDAADVVLINTCAVREHAEERALGRAAQLSGLRRQRPHLVLGILGCMARRLAADLAARAPFVDLVVGPDSYRRLPELLAEDAAPPRLDVDLDRGELYADIAPRRGDGVNAWITVIRGCDKFCSFCVVPFVRGRERSVPLSDVVGEVESLAHGGYRQVTLLGQTVNSYRDGNAGFADLLRAVCAVDGIDRVRFTSPFPRDFEPRTIAAMAELPEVGPALHLPVQSGSENQLALMRRGYTAAAYRALVGQLRQAIPDLALTTDIVVGFCGETESDFARTVALMEELRFDSAFMFKYSERAGTYAARRLADDVPEEVKIERLSRIIELQERISAEVNQRHVGGTVRVLVEGCSQRDAAGQQQRPFGRSEHAKLVVLASPAPVNQLVDVRIREATSHTLLAE